MKLVQPARIPQAFSEFSRASTATFIDAAGVLQTAGVNVVRVQHTSFATNLALRSEDFANAAWQKNQVTLTTGLTVGGLTGVTQVQSNSATNDFLAQPIPLISGEIATTTWRIRQGTASSNTFMRRTSTGTISWALVWTAGVPSAVGVPGGVVVNIESLGNGWFDVSTTAALTENNQGSRLYPDASSAGGTVFVKHAQFEAGAVRNAYVLTAGSAATAGLGVAQVLAEPAATNLLPTSNNFSGWTLGSVTLTPGVPGPFPSMSGTTITATAPSALVQSAAVVTAMVPLVGSVWIRRRSGVGTVSMRVGGGGGGLLVLSSQWQRLSRTEAPLDTTGRFGIVLGTSGDQVDIAGGQLEVGSVATSYIPTTTAAVTRAADVFTPSSIDLTGATGGGFLWTDLVPLAQLYDPSLGYTGAVQRIFRGGVYQVLPGVTAFPGESPQTHPAKWQFVSLDGRLAPFDSEYEARSGQFSVTPAYRYIIGAAGPSDSLLLAGLSEVASISVRITSSLYGPVIFESTLLPPAGQPVVLSQQLFSGFSAPAGAVMEIVLNARPGFAHGLRHIAWGQSESVGATRYGARAGMRDFSRKEADDFGQVQFVRRAFAKTVSASVEVEKTNINRVSDRLYELRATPLVWIFTDDPDLSAPLVVFGFYRDFYSSIDFPQMSIYSLEVEGLA